MTNIENLKSETVQLELKDIRTEVKEALAKLDKDGNEAELLTCDFLDGKKPLRLKIKGTLTSRGIIKKSTAFGTTHTIGVDVSNESMDNLNELTELLNGVKGVDDEWNIKNIFFKNKWYPKLKVDIDNKNRFQCVTVPKMNPSKPNEDLCKGCEVEIDTDVGAWFSVGHETKKCGVYFSFNKVIFNMEEEEKNDSTPPPRKRVKKD